MSNPILSREDEERRIKQLGGKVIHWGRWRVQGVLAVSRAIGDVALQPYVTCEPEIIEKEISKSNLVEFCLFSMFSEFGRKFEKNRDVLFVFLTSHLHFYFLFYFSILFFIFLLYNSSLFLYYIILRL